MKRYFFIDKMPTTKMSKLSNLYYMIRTILLHINYLYLIYILDLNIHNFFVSLPTGDHNKTYYKFNLCPLMAHTLIMGPERAPFSRRGLLFCLSFLLRSARSFMLLFVTPRSCLSLIAHVNHGVLIFLVLQYVRS